MNNLTIVMNVLTEKKETFWNNLTLEENLISAIIISTEDASKLTNREYRDKIRVESKVESILSRGVLKAYSPAYDMIAYK
jgi:hypothetical protein